MKIFIIAFFLLLIAIIPVAAQPEIQQNLPEEFTITDEYLAIDDTLELINTPQMIFGAMPVSGISIGGRIILIQHNGKGEKILGVYCGKEGFEEKKFSYQYLIVKNKIKEKIKLMIIEKKLEGFRKKYQEELYWDK